MNSIQTTSKPNLKFIQLKNHPIMCIFTCTTTSL